MQTKYFPLQQLCGRLKSDIVTMNGCKLLSTATAKPSYCFRLVPLAYILPNPVFRDCRVQHCEFFFFFCFHRDVNAFVVIVLFWFWELINQI